MYPNTIDGNLEFQNVPPVEFIKNTGNKAVTFRYTCWDRNHPKVIDKHDSNLLVQLHQVRVIYMHE